MHLFCIDAVPKARKVNGYIYGLCIFRALLTFINYERHKITCFRCQVILVVYAL